VCCAHSIKLVVALLVPDREVKGKSQDWKTVRVEKNPFFRKKTTTHVSICFFEKKQIFVLFSKKKQKSILNCFHCIVQYHQFQNYTIITCYSLRIMAFKSEGKEMYPIFVFTKCCWSMVRLGMKAHSNQRKATPTQTLQFHVKFMYMSREFSIYKPYFFKKWFGMVQH